MSTQPRPPCHPSLLCHQTCSERELALSQYNPGPFSYQTTSRLLTHTGKISRMIWSENKSKFYSSRDKAWAPIHQSLSSVSAIASVKEAEVRVWVDVGQLASELCTWSVSSWDFMCSRFLKPVAPNFVSTFRLGVPNMVHSGSVMVFTTRLAPTSTCDVNFHYNDGTVSFGVRSLVFPPFGDDLVLANRCCCWHLQLRQGFSCQKVEALVKGPRTCL